MPEPGALSSGTRVRLDHFLPANERRLGASRAFQNPVRRASKPVSQASVSLSTGFVGPCVPCIGRNEMLPLGSGSPSRVTMPLTPKRPSPANHHPQKMTCGTRPMVRHRRIGHPSGSSSASQSTTWVDSVLPTRPRAHRSGLDFRARTVRLSPLSSTLVRRGQQAADSHQQ